MIKKILIPFILLLTVGCQDRELDEVGLITDQAMVVSAHPLASAVGAEIMKHGGNAADAAIAVQFALAVVYPDAGNIGGGGFLVLRQQDGTVDALDYREEAPGAAHRDMYLNEAGEVIEGLSVNGHLAAGVPGTVDGMVQLHEKYGSMPWETLVQPAVSLAAKGFPLTEKEATKLNEYRENFITYSSRRPEFILKDKWRQGDTLQLPDLAKSLARIRDKGRAGFYEGATAQYIVDEMKRGGGIISKMDLANYRAIWRDPLTAQVGEHTVISMPPPSSGGIALIQLLTISENYPVGEWGVKTAKTAHFKIEAEKRVYADRAKHLGDPDFYDVPVEGLLDKTYIKNRMHDFSMESDTDSEQVYAGEPALAEGAQTTHYSIVDPMGNAISVTTTLNSNFGSLVFVDGAGFLLNNEMDDFSAKPGYPNSYGLIGGEANAIAPGKRMLSSMTPTILEKEGELYMVVGSMGGSTIITTVYQIIMNVIVHDLPMQGAVNKGRYHHQWEPDWVLTELGALGPVTGLRLWLMGHKIAPNVNGIGRAAGILVLPDGRMEGGADPRGDDAAAGF
ncbi:gamma-glutamyltransferase [Pontibacter toksunensis]|uniref:Glutathione hydrolase proenzyme n=1 Tax=Pontibacter toksunensis TaxID=1332631 RepID=A0ABW6BY20_9BACT